MSTLTTIEHTSFVLRDRRNVELIGRSWDNWEQADRFAAKLNPADGWHSIEVVGWAIAEDEEGYSAPTDPMDALQSECCQ